MKKGLLKMLVPVCAMICAFGLAACDDRDTTAGNGDGGTQTVAVESVTLDKTELTLDVGDEEALTATVAPDNATVQAVTWSSSDPAVATVEDGKVTALAAGSATITAKAGDKTAACAVTVRAPVIDTVTEEGWRAALTAQINVYTAMATQEGYDLVQKIDFHRNMFYMGLVGFDNPPEGESFITNIFTKEGDRFYSYTSPDNQIWERKQITESEYNVTVSTSDASLRRVWNGLKDEYDLFTFADGEYHADSVEVRLTDNTTERLKDVSVRFENGKLKTLAYRTENPYLNYTVQIAFGVADMELPADFTEKEPAADTEISS